MRIAGISGSLRRDSYNTALLRLAADVLPQSAELTIYRALAKVPAFNDDLLTAPPAVIGDLRAQIFGADAILIATPEYNRSIPGQLKNALDWLSRPRSESPLRGKPVAIVGASTGRLGGVCGQAQARLVLRSIGAEVVERGLAVPHADQGLGGPAVLRELAAVLADLTAAAERRADGTRALNGTVTA